MSELENKEKILSVKNLQVNFRSDHGLVHAVRGVSFDLYKGETLCIVGESGSGKSVTSKTIMGILPANAIISDGQVIFEGEDVYVPIRDFASYVGYSSYNGDYKQYVEDTTKCYVQSTNEVASFSLNSNKTNTNHTHNNVSSLKHITNDYVGFACLVYG